MATYVRLRGLSRRGFRVDSDSRINYSTTATVDIDDQKTLRILQGHEGTFIQVIEFPYTLKIAGAVSTRTTASGLIFRAHKALRLVSVTASVGTAPTGADLILDVHKIASGGAATAAGTTVFTTQGRRPTITAGATVSTLNATAGVPEVTTLAAGDLLRVEVDQVGSTVAGSDLVVTLNLE